MQLQLPIQKLKGIGPKTAAKLQQAGIFTLGDLLYYLPRDYENYQAASQIAEIRPGKVVLKGTISELSIRRARRRNLSITEGTIRDETGAVKVVWFNQTFRAKQFLKDREYYFTGLYDFKNGRYQLLSPSAALVSDIDNCSAFQPLYAARTPLKATDFRRFILKLRPHFASIPDLLPPSAAQPSFVQPQARAEALFKAHFPESPADVTAGRQYLAYEELFILILAALFNKQANQRLQAPPLVFNAAATKQLVQALPFQLTDAQRRATWEILQDLARPVPMNRLLQGDVGSGKTVVAAVAAYQAITQQHQVALLAPTAILATQHATTLERLLAPLGVSVGLLTAATTHKATLKRQIQAGSVNLVVGTHALLTDDTKFHSLALCIIDEQHRFGVQQRQKLLAKSRAAPHLLAMTATPIPRSLQLTIFGDLDISILDQLPKGRQPIQTLALSELDFHDRLYPHIRQTLAQQQQIYWVCPTIETSSMSETISVKQQAQKLSQLFPKARVEFLHGRLKAAEKDAIMTRFAQQQIDILVSTTVVEVGVDVPNATTIVIMDAEHYGLAQLHQLRGRVGRGAAQSFCFLATTGDTNPSRRLRELVHSNDGFYLAEIDLKLRGPGEIYGSLQHGALDLRIASLADTKLLSAARRHAAAVAQTPQNMLKYPELQQRIRRYQQLTTLN